MPCARILKKIQEKGGMLKRIPLSKNDPVWQLLVIVNNISNIGFGLPTHIFSVKDCQVVPLDGNGISLIDDEDLQFRRCFHDPIQVFLKSGDDKDDLHGLWVIHIFSGRHLLSFQIASKKVSDCLQEGEYGGGWV